MSRWVFWWPRSQQGRMTVQDVRRVWNVEPTGWAKGLERGAAKTSGLGPWRLGCSDTQRSKEKRWRATCLGHMVSTGRPDDGAVYRGWTELNMHLIAVYKCIPKGPRPRFSECRKDPKPILKLVLEKLLPASAATSPEVSQPSQAKPTWPSAAPATPDVTELWLHSKYKDSWMNHFEKWESCFSRNWACLDHKVPDRQLPV